jgi:hypothetical protein
MTTQPSGALQQRLLRRALAAGDAARLHVRFRAEVVDRYRELASAELMRTRSVGRVAVAGRWSIDLGIVEEGDLPEGGAPEVHVAFADLVARLPEEEWDHWVAHAVDWPASTNFLMMSLAGGAACLDDGDTVPWE